MGIQAAEILADELTQGVDVLDLLHGQHVEVHAFDARRDELTLGIRLALDEPSLVGAQLESAGILEGELGALLDLDVGGIRCGDVGREVKAREEVVEVEGADTYLHSSLRSVSTMRPAESVLQSGAAHKSLHSMSGCLADHVWLRYSRSGGGGGDSRRLQRRVA